MAQDKQDQAMDPEGAMKAGRGGFAEEPESDAEGHTLKRNGGLAEGSGAEPEGGIRLPQSQDDEARNPTDPDDVAHFSDRNLKVAIVPVTW